MDLDYLTEKLCQARSSLMAPHYSSTMEEVFLSAFEICSRVKHELEELRVAQDAGRWAATILDTMDTSSVESDPTGEGLWHARFAQLRELDLRAFSEAIDALATWVTLARDRAEQRRSPAGGPISA